MLALFVMMSAALLMSARAQFTDIAEMLNKAVEACPSEFYGQSCGNTGVIWRTNDRYDTSLGFAKPPFDVVPATLLTDEIYSPTKYYPCGDPHNAADFYRPVVGRIIYQNMNQLFHDFDNFQNHGTYDFGVMYPTDSNSVDGRCRYLKDDYNGIIDCPEGWYYDNVNDPDSSKWGFSGGGAGNGAGYYASGNPQAGLGGGGAGCHWDNHGQNQNGPVYGLNQFNAYNNENPGQNLVKDLDCQCNDFLQGDGDWEPWIKTALYGNDDGENEPSYQGYWASNNASPAPTYIIDWSGCWMNNPTDMIALQNQMFVYQDKWWDYTEPTPDFSGGLRTPDSLRPYNGWNEIPVDESVVNDPNNWDTLAIGLPAGICWKQNGETDGSFGDGDELSCLDQNTAGKTIECQITDYVYQGWLVPGEDKQGSRPGSYMLVMKSQQDPNDSGRWQSVFFCEEWTSPNQYWQLKYDAPNGCYIDYGPNPIDPWKDNVLCNPDGSYGGDGASACTN